MKFLAQFIKPVYAHCDVPCGIYETDTMMHAVDTCIRMTEKMADLGDFAMQSDAHNNYIRMVATKEKHAQLCKEQLLVLWTDYCKPEHLAKYPNLHETFWKTAKQCSKVKQSAATEEARTLQTMVAEVAAIFKETQTK